MQSACSSRKRRGKTPRQICHVIYYEWNLKITRFRQDITFKHYNYPKEVLNYIHALLPNNVKGEVLENWYKVSLKQFCEALQNKFLQCFIGSQFWEIHWKKFAAKISL